MPPTTAQEDDPFEQGQLSIANRVSAREVEFVDLDSDGTWMNWILVVIERPTGIVYGTQCGGTSCVERFVEGYLVPIGGLALDPDSGAMHSASLTAPFHRNRGCFFGGPGQSLPADRLAELDSAVGGLTYWHHQDTVTFSRTGIQIDHSRHAELCEAWVPVITPAGKGVLLWDNCD